MATPRQYQVVVWGSTGAFFVCRHAASEIELFSWACRLRWQARVRVPGQELQGAPKRQGEGGREKREGERERERERESVCV